MPGKLIHDIPAEFGCYFHEAFLNSLRHTSVFSLLSFYFACSNYNPTYHNHNVVTDEWHVIHHSDLLFPAVDCEFFEGRCSLTVGVPYLFVD